MRSRSDDLTRSLLPPFAFPIIEELAEALGRCSSLRHLALHGIDMHSYVSLSPSFERLQLASLRLDIYGEGRLARPISALRIPTVELGLDAYSLPELDESLVQLFTSIEHLTVHLGGTTCQLAVSVARRLIKRHPTTLKSIQIDNVQTVFARGAEQVVYAPFFAWDGSTHFTQLRRWHFNGVMVDQQQVNVSSHAPFELVVKYPTPQLWTVEDDYRI